MSVDKSTRGSQAITELDFFDFFLTAGMALVGVDLGGVTGFSMLELRPLGSLPLFTPGAAGLMSLGEMGGESLVIGNEQGLEEGT